MVPEAVMREKGNFFGVDGLGEFGGKILKFGKVEGNSRHNDRFSQFIPTK